MAPCRLPRKRLKPKARQTDRGREEGREGGIAYQHAVVEHDRMQPVRDAEDCRPVQVRSNGSLDRGVCGEVNAGRG